ncbi:hypothetical protein PAXRUDRAFT_18293 [Paxillus rubicundulus Ve08.2h10]|uniref:Uncharacterized protein n=1 Tax=Paxillus rubicundulus Ve08.2h10 TaxID=930991 RepID=A0A0D0BYV2_9AGAM|nr:hypothetical protein PAXRUDRAFT_18293 [Paxillus rubicundulus Ve08.2h10]
MPNHYAISEGVDPDGDKLVSDQDHTQMELDGFVFPVSKWTKEGLLDHIMEFVITEDQSYTVVDKGSF